MKVLLLSLLLASISLGQLAPLHTAEQYTLVIEALTAPAKLDALKGKRAATPRLRRLMYWLRLAQRDGFDPATIIDEGQKLNLSAGTERAKLIKQSLLRNLDILTKLGCVDVDGIGKLRTGQRPDDHPGAVCRRTSHRGPHHPEIRRPRAGQQPFQSGVHASDLERAEGR